VEKITLGRSKVTQKCLYIPAFSRSRGVNTLGSTTVKHLCDKINISKVHFIFILYYIMIIYSKQDDMEVFSELSDTSVSSGDIEDVSSEDSDGETTE
jgi:hypothetical protein